MNGFSGRRSRTRALLSALLTSAVLAVAAAVYLAPVIFMIVGSFKPDEKVLAEAGTIRAFFPRELTADNYRDVFERVDFLHFMLNSLFITGSIVAGGLVVNSLAAYAFARLAWRGRNVLFAFVLSLMILPFEAIAVPLFYEITTLGWRDSYVAQILPFVANAFSIYLFYTFFIGLPRELEEGGRIDGAGTLRIFFEIIVPNCKPVFATVTIVTILFYWGFFLWPLLVTSGEEYRPLPVAVAQFYSLPPLKWGDILAFGVMMVAPALIAFFLLQRWLVRGLAAGGVKG
jgi:multiple sugar transport system permease protein